jgi:hypothetical protein
MTYSVLKMVEAWAKEQASQGNINAEYRTALLALASAARAVMRFN